jgi:hypothetical protein
MEDELNYFFLTSVKTSKKMKDDLKHKMEEDLKQNGRQP